MSGLARVVSGCMTTLSNNVRIAAQARRKNMFAPSPVKCLFMEHTRSTACPANNPCFCFVYTIIRVEYVSCDLEILRGFVRELLFWVAIYVAYWRSRAAFGIRSCVGCRFSGGTKPSGHIRVVIGP